MCKCYMKNHMSAIKFHEQGEAHKLKLAERELHPSFPRAQTASIMLAAIQYDSPRIMLCLHRFGPLNTRGAYPPILGTRSILNADLKAVKDRGKQMQKDKDMAKSMMGDIEKRARQAYEVCQLLFACSFCRTPVVAWAAAFAAPSSPHPAPARALSSGGH